jgi:N-acetylglucosamine-6-phosphate deacetylase
MKRIWLTGGTILTGYMKMDACSLMIEGERIGDVVTDRRFAAKSIGEDDVVIPLHGAYVSPGFIDSHIHGFGGFGVDDCSVESILGMSRALVSHGVTGFCPTVYTGERRTMEGSLAACADAMGREDGARILGIHMEGPFISPKRVGAQSADGVAAVDLALMERLWHAAGKKIVTMTVAPELKGMRELALWCMKREITLQAGHTDADYEQMLEGMQAGILHSTHFFNAMSRLHHRNPGAVGTIMIHPEISCEIIADGHHVHPGLIKLLLRDKPVSKVVLVTDALALAGTGKSEGRANGMKISDSDGVFRLEDGTIAGSSLTMLKGIANLTEWGVPLEHAVQMAGSNPARIFDFSRRGLLIPSYQADIAVFDHNFRPLMTFIGGELAFKADEIT